MRYRIIVSEYARADIREAMAWWRDHRSAEQAERWYDMIYPAIATLDASPDRCPLAPEADLLPTGLRELHFGVRRKTTHRIVFTIDGQDVVILRVLHVSRRNLTDKDFLPGS